jgi:enoyl-CoA hydratase/carnithine racemase
MVPVPALSKGESIMQPSDPGLHVRLENDQGILRVILNRPEKKNALTRQMYASLAEALVTADQDPAIRVVLLHGSSTCFTSGNDLHDFVTFRTERRQRPVNPFLEALSQARKPIVAAVGGPAIGIGTTLLLHCDLVYAARSALFRLPFVDIGLCPEAGSSYLLPKLVGHQHAAEWLMLAEPFDAEAACRLGLVNAVVADDELLSHAMEKARKLAQKPLASLLLTKALIKRGSEVALKETMALEMQHFSARLQSPECAEALDAFFAGRKPEFSQY